MQHDDGTGNFTANDDGRPGSPSTSTTGYDYAKSLISYCNGQMDQNPVLHLAPGSLLTPIPKRVHWVLDGVYFDRSSFYRNGTYNPDHVPALGGHNYETQCVKGDSIINIFLVEEEIWPYDGPIGNTNYSNPVAAPAIRGYVYNQARCDIYPAPATMWAVVSSPWTNYILQNRSSYFMASAVNHELCHLMGLNHPYQYSFYNWGECPDAPGNANCWNLDTNNANCDDWSKVSNNLMDTNADQIALAPCQINIIQNNLNTCLQSRYVYKCSDCMPPGANFELAPGTCGSLVNIWLDGRATWNANYFILEIDQVYNSAPTIVIPGTTHYGNYFNRAPGWEQLDALYTFAANSTYRVKLTAISPSSCATALRVHTFSTSACVGRPAAGPASSTPTLSPRQ